jgi:hypothetical protein
MKKAFTGINEMGNTIYYSIYFQIIFQEPLHFSGKKPYTLIYLNYNGGIKK